METKSYLRPLVLLLMAVVVPISGSMVLAQTQRLVVWHKDGQKTYYDLTEQPKTTFSGPDIIISTKGLTVSYPLDQVLRYTYELSTSSISTVSQPSPVHFIQKGSDLVIENLKKGDTVQVFATDGKLVASQCSDGSRAITISLNGYSAGVYIVKANGATFKMLNR